MCSTVSAPGLQQRKQIVSREVSSRPHPPNRFLTDLLPSDSEQIGPQRGIDYGAFTFALEVHVQRLHKQPQIRL